MQQKKLNDILYVFDITPYVITQDTDADIIKVQQECYEGYVELNPTLADKIVKYNYHMFTVQQQEWAPYVDQDDKPSPELAWSADSVLVTIGADDNIFPTLSNPHSVTVTYASSNTENATIDSSTGAITLLHDGGTTISAVFEGNEDYAAQTVTYILAIQQAQPSQGHTLTLDGSNIHLHVNVYFDNVQQTVEYQYQDVAENTVIDIYPTADPSYYTLSQGATWDTDHWTATMPDADLLISISYSAPLVQTITVYVPAQSGSDPLENKFYDVTESDWAQLCSYYSNQLVGANYEVTLASGHTYEIDERNTPYEFELVDHTSQTPIQTTQGALGQSFTLSADADVVVTTKSGYTFECQMMDWAYNKITVNDVTNGNNPIYGLPAGTVVKVFNKAPLTDGQGNANYTLGSTYNFVPFGGTSDYGYWEFTIVADTTVSIQYTGVPQTPNYGLSFNSDTDEMPQGQAGYAVPVYNEHNVGLTYYSSNTSIATIDTSTLIVSPLAAGSCYIYAVSTPDGTYGENCISYLLTVEGVQPTADQGVTVTYNVQDTSEPLKIYGWPDDSYASNVPDQMYVDGVSKTVAQTYQFSTTGSHTIQYIFNDGCFDIGLDSIGSNESYNNIYVTDVTVGEDITSVADYAWGIKAGNEPGASDAEPLPLTYLPTVPPTINSTGASAAEAPGTTVYVPSDSVSAYQAASVWSDISSLITAISA